MFRILFLLLLSCSSLFAKEWFLICTDAVNPETNQQFGIVAYNSEQDDSLWVCTQRADGFYASWTKIYKSPYVRIQTQPVSIGGAYGVYIPSGSDPGTTLWSGYNGGHLNSIRLRTVKLTTLMSRFKVSVQYNNVPWPPE